MRICAVTITSKTREHLIGDAFKSVEPFVSDFLIIHLYDADGDDQTLGVAREIAGKRLTIVNASIKEGMPALRNRGLAKAHKLGAEWALMLDTDERTITNGVDIRAALEFLPDDVHAVDIQRVGGCEQRTKLIRLPASGGYSGLMHEEYRPKGNIETIAGVRFSEVGCGGNDRKPSSCIPHIERQIEEEPKRSRWRFYLGLLLEHDKRLEEAIAAYDKVDNKILSGWVSFRKACCYAKMGCYEQALQTCCAGMELSPTHAELPWFASYQAIQMGEAEKALCWAKMAHGLSWVGIPERFITRRGPRHIKAFYEGPLEVMQMAYNALGMDEQADQAERAVVGAKRARISVWGEVE